MIETATRAIEPASHTLEVPTAILTYDIRRADATADAPALLLIGSPMGAAGFATLARSFPDRTVVTYDPRGAERSRRTDGGDRNTVEEQADDLHRLIERLDAGPVDIFASSGGAVNALALVERHPEQVRTLVAHEPPLAQLLPDREAALAACRDIHDTYLRAGFGAGMAKFLVLVSHKGTFTPGFAAGPDPDPAMFGLPTDDDGSRGDVLLGMNMIPTTHYEPDLDALLRASTRIVVAAGVESEGELACRGAVALAELLGTSLVTFPSGHGGFAGGEYGHTGEPEAFAAKLREVLST
jgi:pimeloyl-ACP methyl ester carboxylesterase